MEQSIEILIERLPVLKVLGPRNKVIRQVVSAERDFVGEGDLTWISDKYQERLQTFRGAVVILSNMIPSEKLVDGNTYLIVESPRLYFLKVLATFFSREPTHVISQKAFISDSATVGVNVNIAHGVVIEEECSIGDDTSIDCNSVIKAGTIIGKKVKIGANNTIGGVGFGYEKDDGGQYVVIPHIGNVIIEDGVEIGNNTTIDRAVLGSTIIRANAKIDNLVHIAHGVEIGENSLVIANAMIAGSVVIGKNVWIAPSVSVLNKKKVGDNALIGMGAVVLKDVEAGKTVVGNPAKELLPKNP